MIVARLGRGWPLALVAVTAPTSGCSLSHPPTETRADAGPADAAPSDAGLDARPPPRDFGPPPLCFGGEETFTVEVPPPGVPADASMICVSDEDAISNEAARVSFVLDPVDARIARGTITIDPALRAGAIGTPTVELVDRGFIYWPDATLGTVSADGDAFRFDATFSSPVEGDPYSDARAVFEVRFELDCGGGARRTVIATTIVHVCIEDDRTLSFASSGEECRTCAIIAEMAPTPIIPAEKPDRLPLQQGMHLELRVLARFPNAVVLWAEHDSGSARYEWHATEGTLHRVEDDIAVWEIGEHPFAAAQVVVETDDAAGIATYRRGGTP